VVGTELRVCDRHGARLDAPAARSPDGRLRPPRPPELSVAH
jgi:hypothetical protein